MKAAAAELEFEKAALLRDQISELREQLRLLEEATDTRPAWEKIK
jgi:protein-arginine kinase activator protein McsA